MNAVVREVAGRALRLVNRVGGSGVFVSALNRRITGLGKVTALDIDTVNRTIAVRLDLLGEESPVDVRINGYSVEREDGRIYITIADLTVSRAWMQAAALRLVVGRRLAVPREHEAIACMLG